MEEQEFNNVESQARICEGHSPWGDAMADALKLAAVSIAVMAISLYLPANVAFIGSILSLAKFAVSIWLVTFFMRKYADRFDAIGQGQVFRYGAKTTLLSSVLCAGFQLLAFTVLKPDMVSEAIDTVMGQYGSSLPQEAIDMIYGMLDKLPQLSFIYSLFIWWIIGLATAAITAPNLKKNNIF